MLQIANLHKRFGDVAALRGVDLAIGAGETGVVLGPTGAGKTTLLAHHRRAGDPGQRLDSSERGGDRRLVSGGAGRRPGVPEFRPLPRLDGAAKPRVSPARPGPAGDAERDRRARAVGCGDAADRALARPRFRTAVRRGDAASGDRAGDRAPPAAVPDGRAADQSRRQTAGGAARRARAPEA